MLHRRRHKPGRGDWAMPRGVKRPRAASGDDGATGVKAQFIELLQKDAANNGSGVSTQTLKEAFPGDDYARCAGAINELLQENRLELLKEAGSADLTYRLRAAEAAERLGDLTNEQLLVLQTVERAENAGVWLRDIKNATSMQQQTLNKALKVLEARKLVKTVKSVQQKTKKLYMAYDLTPTREVSGGPWYTDQEFDHEFVDGIKRFVVKFVTEKQHCTLEDIHAALAKSRISTVPLEIGDVRLVVDTLLCDARLEQLHLRTAAGRSVHFKIAKPAVDVAWVAAIPCGACPWPRCAVDGRHTPATCQYLEKWLDAPEEDGPA